MGSEMLDLRAWLLGIVGRSDNNRQAEYALPAARPDQPGPTASSPECRLSLAIGAKGLPLAAEINRPPGW